MVDVNSDILLERIHRPIFETNIYVLISCIFNTLLSSMIYQSPPKYFLLLTFYFGFSYQFLLATIDVFQFWFMTLCLFSAFFCVSMIINRLFGWRHCNILKCFIFVNALYCFKPHVNKPHIEDFVLTYMTLSIKLLNAAENMKSKGDELLKLYSIMSYMAYTPWLLFNNFLFLTENFKNLKDVDWWYMVTTSWPKAMLFRILSRSLIEADVLPDFFIKSQLLQIIHSFQYRCKYYFHAQIGELQLLTAGIQRMNWMEVYICDPEQAELSISSMNFFKELNRPTSVFFILKVYGNKTVQEKLLGFLIDTILVLTVILSYHGYYAYLCTLFAVSMCLEQFVLAEIEDLTCVCFASCPYLFCDHFLELNNCLYFYVKILLCLYNKYYMSLLFVKGAAIIFSIENLYCIIFINIFLVMLMLLLKTIKQ